MESKELVTSHRIELVACWVVELDVERRKEAMETLTGNDDAS